MRPCGRGEFVGLCPFHVETHPSFFLNVEHGRFFCFGCAAGGDVYRFLEILCGCDFREAVRQVAGLASGKSLSLPALAARQGRPLEARGAGGRSPHASFSTRLQVARKAQLNGSSYADAGDPHFVPRARDNASGQADGDSNAAHVR